MDTDTMTKAERKARNREESLRQQEQARARKAERQAKQAELQKTQMEAKAAKAAAKAEAKTQAPVGVTTQMDQMDVSGLSREEKALKNQEMQLAVQEQARARKAERALRVAEAQRIAAENRAEKERLKAIRMETLAKEQAVSAALKAEKNALRRELAGAKHLEDMKEQMEKEKRTVVVPFDPTALVDLLTKQLTPCGTVEVLKFHSMLNEFRVVFADAKSADKAKKASIKNLNVPELPIKRCKITSHCIYFTPEGEEGVTPAHLAGAQAAYKKLGATKVVEVCEIKKKVVVEFIDLETRARALQLTNIKVCGQPVTDVREGIPKRVGQQPNRKKRKIDDQAVPMSA